MTELSTLARPYAEALFDLAKETQAFETWSQSLAFLTALVQEPHMERIIANPRIDKATLTRLLLDICEEHTTPEVNNLIKLLVENHRLPVIPHIATQFEELKTQHQGQVKVQIISSYPVNAQQQKEVETVLEKRLGKAVDINIILDETLVGGWIIRAGDEVVDLSIKGRLEQLATELRH